MPAVKTRDGKPKHEPYPLNEFTEDVIQSIAKRIVYLKAVGRRDMSGDEFDHIFAESITGRSFGRPLGIADVAWSKCCWSVKTIKGKKPHTQKKVRLICGRNNPNYSADIENPYDDIAQTGRAVLEIYNQRIDTAKSDYDDLRMLVLVRNMETLEFTIYERPITPFVPANYRWKLNKKRNFQGYDGETHVFTWQPHGSQFTILEPIPASATRFRIKKNPGMIEMEDVLQSMKYEPNWVEILPSTKPL